MPERWEDSWYAAIWSIHKPGRSRKLILNKGSIQEQSKRITAVIIRYRIRIVAGIFLLIISAIFYLVPEKTVEDFREGDPIKGRHSNEAGYSSLESNPYKGADLSVEVISVSGETYGYNIVRGGQTIIHQPVVPALSGTTGFHTKEDARKVGIFVKNKIHQNILPPVITVAELDSLGVL